MVLLSYFLYLKCFFNLEGWPSVSCTSPCHWPRGTVVQRRWHRSIPGYFAAKIFPTSTASLFLLIVHHYIWKCVYFSYWYIKFCAFWLFASIFKACGRTGALYGPIAYRHVFVPSVKIHASQPYKTLSQMQNKSVLLTATDNYNTWTYNNITIHTHIFFLLTG